MSDHGSYRGIYCSLIDDPDYQQLPANARLVLVTLRICPDAGPGVIFRYYPEMLSRQTGLPAQTVLKAMAILKAQGWILYDSAVVWVRNGLKYDPYVRLTNPHHRTAVEKQVRTLPRRELVLKFCDYYGIERPFPGTPEVLPLVPEDHPTSTSIPLTPPSIHIAPLTDTEEDREVRTERGVDADTPPTHRGVAFRIPEHFLDALDRAPHFRQVAVLRQPAFWQSQLRAHPGVEFGDEILKAEAWLTANRRHLKNQARFLHNWFARAYEDQEDES